MAFDDSMLDPQQWVGAVCSDTKKYDPDIWFEHHTEQQAKEICKTCPLLLKCAQYAVEKDEPFGVWGGLSPTDRRTLRGKRSNAKFGTRLK